MPPASTTNDPDASDRASNIERSEGLPVATLLSAARILSIAALIFASAPRLPRLESVTRRATNPATIPDSLGQLLRSRRPLATLKDEASRASPPQSPLARAGNPLPDSAPEQLLPEPNAALDAVLRMPHLHDPKRRGSLSQSRTRLKRRLVGRDGVCGAPLVPRDMP